MGIAGWGLNAWQDGLWHLFPGCLQGASLCWPSPLAKGTSVNSLFGNQRDLWPLRHLIRVMRRHDLTKKKTMTKTKTNTKTKTKTMTKTNTFREHLQRAILETCDLWDIWSEWWGDMTWPKKIYLPTCLPTSTYLHPYIREHHSRACLSMTFSFLMYMGSGALLHIWYI